MFASNITVALLVVGMLIVAGGIGYLGANWYNKLDDALGALFKGGGPILLYLVGFIGIVLLVLGIIGFFF